MVLCAACCTGCFFLLHESYNKYLHNPTITTVVSTNYPVWNIEFPAVTVCPNNRAITQCIRMAKKSIKP